VGGWINVDDSVQERAWRRRTDRISARVEEMRQQTVAGLRIFVDDDELAIGKSRDGGIGLGSRQPARTAVEAEVALLLAERVKSGSYCRLPISCSDRSAAELGVERS
jgi:hypothetical protein